MRSPATPATNATGAAAPRANSSATDLVEIKKRIAALASRLIAVETPALAEDALRQLITGTQCATLLIN